MADIFFWDRTKSGFAKSQVILLYEYLAKILKTYKQESGTISKKNIAAFYSYLLRPVKPLS